MIPFALIAFSLISSSDLGKIDRIERSSSVAQGQFIYIRLESNSSFKDGLQLYFFKKEVPCYPASNNQWECFEAVPADSKIGTEKAKILSRGKAVTHSKIEILRTAFPVEPLSLTPDKKSLLSQDGRETELKKIRSSLSTETPEKLYDQQFIQPIEGVFESLYGEKRTLDGKVRKGYHRGLDLGAAEGTPILSANDGKVILAGNFIEEGNMVIINHGQGILSAYLHLSEILVQEGQSVQRGEPIGRVGSTGVANTPHLHFGIYIHGAPIDPLYWLKQIH